MGLEKLVVRQVVKVAKDTGRLENTIDTMRIKLVDEGIRLIESTGINPADLPFTPQDLLNGNVDDPSILLTPNAVCGLPPLTNTQKEKGEKTLESVLAAINGIIVSKNKIVGTLQTIQTPLNVINTTGSTLNTIIGTVKNAVKIIKAIPIPTAIIPPTGGIGLPINILTILSDSLDQLDKLLTYGKGITSAIPQLTGGVINMIDKTITSLNSLDDTILPLMTTLAFTKTVIEKGDSCPGLTQSEINIVQQEIQASIEESLIASGNNSDNAINIANEEALLDALKFNAFPGLIYKGFRLTLELDPSNQFSFSSRRIRAFRDFIDSDNPANGEDQLFYRGIMGIKTGNNLSTLTLYNSPKSIDANDYSYSLSVQVLYEEMKYKIDTFLLSLRISIPRDELEIGRDGEIIENNNTGSDTGSDTGNVTGSIDNGGDMDYVLNGPNIVQPLGLIEGNEVTGTIVVNVPIKVAMTTIGGNGSNTYTNTILQFQKGNKPANAQSRIEQYVSGYDVETSLPIQLPETGIWNYSMKIIGNYGVNANQSNFAITLL